jgi:hypothetical protein
MLLTVLVELEWCNFISMVYKSKNFLGQERLSGELEIKSGKKQLGNGFIKS